MADKGRKMGSSDWKVVGDDAPRDADTMTPTPTVRLRLGEVFPLLAAAHGQRATWLLDLADDEIVVSLDLAQILGRYRQILEEKSA